MKEIKSAILNNHSLLQDFGNAFKRCDKDCEFKDFLRKLLESRNRTIKRVAAEVTGNFFRGTNDKTLFEALKVLLKVDDFKVKMETVNALGSIFEKTGNQQVIELLLRFLIYDVSTFHFDYILAFNIVVRNICRIGNNSRKYREFILKLVEKVLKEKSMFAQQAVAEILGYTFRGTGDLKAFELLMKYFADAGINETMIITLGDIFRGTGLEMRILEKMLNTLTTEKLKIILIRELFKESGSIVALEMLKTFVRPIFLSENETEADYLDDDFEIRGELAQALKEIFRGTDNGEVIDILKYIFEDIEEDFYNALEAAYAIYEVAPGSYEDYLLRILKRYIRDSEEEIICYATDAICHIFKGTGNLKAVEALKPLFFSRKLLEAQEIASLSVKEIFEGTDLETKIKMLYSLEDILEHGRNCGWGVLLETIGNFFKGTADLRIFNFLKQALKNSDYECAINSFVMAVDYIFLKSCNKTVAKFLHRILLEYDDFYTREYTMDVIVGIFDPKHCKNISFLRKILNAYLKNDNEYIRGLAIRMYGEIFKGTADKRIVNKVKKYFDDVSDFVRTEAIKAVGMIYESTCNIRMLNILKTYLINDKDSDTVIAAILHALGLIFKHSGNTQVFDLLKTYISHTNEKISYEASSGIVNIFKDSG
ncbi:MAG: hypothetical protein J7L47_02565, partial [Candidatus Odinarchaeota archaeon]|nr:hypothetical protein [Candidatus Odinarchaeota archaeon]